MKKKYNYKRCRCQLAMKVIDGVLRCPKDCPPKRRVIIEKNRGPRGDRT